MPLDVTLRTCTCNHAATCTLVLHAVPLSPVPLSPVALSTCNHAVTCTLVLLHPRNIQCSRVPTRAAVQGRERRGTGPHQCPHSGVPCVGACSSTCAATRCARPRAPATRSRTCRSMRHREVACRHSRARHWPPAPHPVIAACDGRPPCADCSYREQTLRTLCLQGTACSHRTRTCTPTAVAVTHSPPLSFPQRNR